MKAALNFLMNAWALVAASIFAAMFVYTLGQGVELLKYWVWVVLAAIAIVAGAMAVAQKNAKWLFLIPIFALPMFLISGLQSSTAIVPSPVLSSDSANKQNSIQDASRKVLGAFFTN